MPDNRAERCRSEGGRWDDVKETCSVDINLNDSRETSQNYGGGSTNDKDAGIAALISFLFPGGGQIYAGKITRGILISILFGISVLSVFVLVGIVLAPLVYFWQVYDAAQIAGS